MHHIYNVPASQFSLPQKTNSFSLLLSRRKKNCEGVACTFRNFLGYLVKVRHISANRFHPDHLQEFLTQKKKKSDGWKCDVSYLPCYLQNKKSHPKYILLVCVGLTVSLFCRSVTSPSLVAPIWRST